MVMLNQPDAFSNELREILEITRPPHRRQLWEIRRWLTEVCGAETRASVFRKEIDFLRERGLLRCVGDAFESTEAGLAVLGRA